MVLADPAPHHPTAILATMALTITTRPWADLTPHPDNPRNGDTDAIAASLRTNGQYKPIVTTTDGTILAGNHTYMAAGEIGMPTLECVVLDLDPHGNDAKRIMLADNRTSDTAQYDYGLLLQLLAELDADGALEGSGYTDTDYKDLEHRNRDRSDPWTDRDYKPEPEPERVRPGQRWRLGDHTLICGDSTDPATWEGLPPANLVIADPPYGIDYTGGGGLERQRINGDASGQAAAEVTLAAYRALPTTSGAVYYTFCASGRDGLAVKLALDQAGLYRWGLVWVKNNATFSRADYHQQHEDIIYGAEHEDVAYGWRDGETHPRVEDRTRTTVLRHDRPTVSDLHPTMKPVSLITELITNHNLPRGSIVADPFGGSATTLRAAEAAGVTAITCELSPGYVEGAINAWDQANPDRPAERITDAQ